MASTRPVTRVELVAAARSAVADGALGRRRERRELALLGALGPVAGSPPPPPAIPGLLSQAVWWAVVMLTLDWHLGMLERPDSTRIDGFGPANALGLVAIGAVPLMPALDAGALAVLVLTSARST